MNNKNKIFFASTGLALTAGVLIYLFSKKKAQPIGEREKNIKQISKATLVKILKEISKESYSIFQGLAMMSNQIKEQSRGRIPANELRDYLINQS